VIASIGDSTTAWLAARPLRVPLRIAGRRFWLWGLVCAVVGAAISSNSPSAGYVDFPQFWAAGRTVGTANLLDRGLHGAWEAANGVTPDLFPYTPGTAWLFAPFSVLPMAAGFWAHAVVMTVLVGVAGFLAGRTFGLQGRVGLIAAFAWGPCMVAVAFGQNAPLALLLVVLAIEGLRRDSDGLVGLGAGLLLYKPTIAIPLLALLLLRRRWRALGFAALVAAGWYFASVAATAGDWLWPIHLLSALGVYYGPNTSFNAIRATSIPGVLVGNGAPPIVAWGLAAAVVVAAIPRLLRSPIVEAAAGACLVGLAVSPHSLNYEAALALPAILWTMGGLGTGIREPARTWLIVGYCVAGLAILISLWAGLSSVGLAVLAMTFIWISGWQRLDAGSQTLAATAADPSGAVSPALASAAIPADPS
jgi:hypothetical protein